MISYLKLGVLVKHVKENLGHQTANLHSSQWEKSTQIPKLFITKKPAKKSWNRSAMPCTTTSSFATCVTTVMHTQKLDWRKLTGIDELKDFLKILL